MLRRAEPGMIDAPDEMSSIQGPAALRIDRNGLDYVEAFLCQIPRRVNSKLPFRKERPGLPAGDWSEGGTDQSVI